LSNYSGPFLCRFVCFRNFLSIFLSVLFFISFVLLFLPSSSLFFPLYLYLLLSVSLLSCLLSSPLFFLAIFLSFCLFQSLLSAHPLFLPFTYMCHAHHRMVMQLQTIAGSPLPCAHSLQPGCLVSQNTNYSSLKEWKKYLVPELVFQLIISVKHSGSVLILWLFLPPVPFMVYGKFCHNSIFRTKVESLVCLDLTTQSIIAVSDSSSSVGSFEVFS
jgi:hypothetical protein